MKIVIIGGNAAGMSAASRIKRRAPQHDVLVLEKSGEVSYGACGMPYYVADINPDLNKLRIRTVDKFRESGVDVRLHTEVTKVDREKKEVTATADGTEFTVPYDRLLVASGSSAIRPPIPGIGLKGIYTLKTLEDAAQLKEAIAPEKKVLIVGGGYIGLEIAEACHIRGVKDLTVVEGTDHVLTTFDDEFSDMAAEELRKNGINLRLGERVEGFEGDGSVSLVRTSGGSYEADVVVLSIGVRPNTSFVDVDKLPNGAIITDPQMRTSDPDIFAAGDCSAVWHRILQKPAYLPLGTNANKQGRLAGDSMLGKAVCFDRPLGTSMLRLIGMEFGCTGLTEKQAKANGIAYKTNTVTSRTHAGYHPPTYNATVKLLWDPETKVILGAQLAGPKETAIRTDIFAVAIDRKMTTEELGFVDLGYAPPFASVWDVVHIAANAAK